jgi:hypothetical protein
MINKEEAKNKFKEIEYIHLQKIIDVSLKEFPKKLDMVLKNTRDQFYQEARFYARNIREAYAFVFHDTELNNICHQLENALEKNDRASIMQHVRDLQIYADAFLEELKSFRTEIEKK